MKHKLFANLLVGACNLAAAQTHAAIVEWTFNDVLFDDGGTVTGSFKIDFNDGSSDINIATDIFDINIQASAGSAISSAMTFDKVRSLSTTPPFSGSPGFKFPSIAFSPSLAPFDQIDFSNFIVFGFSDGGISLLNTDVTVLFSQVLLIGNGFETAEFFSSGQSTENDLSDLGDAATNAGVFERKIISGSITGLEVAAVPIPAAAWLFGAALIGLMSFK